MKTYSAYTTPPGTPVEPELEKRVQETISRMTQEEKCGMLAGTDDWHIRGIPRLGVPSVRVTDCGHGVTLAGERSSPATCFPTASAMAATWNRDLLQEAGRVIGRETRALGCSILLGPKLNLHRVPVNGRCFETFSEDPHLAGKLAAAVARGIQDEGVGACIKAMLANNQQKDQSGLSVEADERTLRELYLRAFEIAARESAPVSIMTSYNWLHGKPTSESRWMLTEVIKEEWAFPGFIVSDWRAVHTSESIPAGLDLEMPGPGKFMHTAGIKAALESGVLSEDELNDRVARLLRAVVKYGQEETVYKEKPATLDSEENRACALAVAEEAIVLLKNDGPVLPLNRKELKRIAVLGPNAAAARLGGGGSASVTPFFSVSPLEGIRELVGQDLEIEYAEGVGLLGSMSVVQGFSHESGKSGLKAQFFNGSDFSGPVVLEQSVPQVDFSWGWAAPGPGVLRGGYCVRFSGELTAEHTAEYTLGVFGQEGDVRLWVDGELLINEWDADPNAIFEAAYAVRYKKATLDLEAGKPVSIVLEYKKLGPRGAIRFEWERKTDTPAWQDAVEKARKADVAIVCAGLSNFFEGGNKDRDGIEIPATQVEFIKAVAAANPRTIVVLNAGGPLAMPWIDSVPAVLHAWYPGQSGGTALARLLFGEVNPSAKLPDTFAARIEDIPAMQYYPGDGKQVHYREGLNVGYRYFDQAEVEPQFPFGFGLSYTTFSYSNLRLSGDLMEPEGELTVSVDICNTGARAGKEIVQLYVRDVECSIARPRKELRNFAKIDLKPGERKTVSLPVKWDDLAFFHPEKKQWLVEAGEFEALVGPDSRNLQAARFRVE